MNHPCPHPACSRMVPRERFGCRDHWFSLPKPIRDDIMSAWRLYQRDWHQGAQVLIDAQRRAMIHWGAA